MGYRIETDARPEDYANREAVARHVRIYRDATLLYECLLKPKDFGDPFRMMEEAIRSMYRLAHAATIR